MKNQKFNYKFQLLLERTNIVLVDKDNIIAQLQEDVQHLREELERCQFEKEQLIEKLKRLEEVERKPE